MHVLSVLHSYSIEVMGMHSESLTFDYIVVAVARSSQVERCKQERQTPIASKYTVLSGGFLPKCTLCGKNWKIRKKEALTRAGQV